MQQGERLCKILYICNKGSIHVRSSISATRGALMKDPLNIFNQDLILRCHIENHCKIGSSSFKTYKRSLFVFRDEKQIQSLIL